MLRYLFVGLFLLSFLNPLLSQVNNKKINKYIQVGNYNAVESIYATALSEDPNNFDLNMKMGECQLNLRNPLRATDFFKQAVQVKSDNEKAWTELVKAQTLAGKYQDAIDLMDRAPLKQMAEKDEELRTLKNNLKIGKTLTQHPLSVNITNLGAKINSPASEIIPFVSSNDSVMIFCSNRKGVKGSKMKNGTFPFEVMRIRKYELGWTASEAVKELASPLNEIIVGTSSDLDQLVLIIGSKSGHGSIMAYKMIDGVYVPTQELDDLFKKVSNIGGLTISEDGQEMIFSAEMKDGLGGKDLYHSKLLPNGKWAEPLNLGETINTKEEEEHPVFAQYDQYVYFSSNGHPGMGNKDIFKTKLQRENIWKSPLNMGYPINSAYDEHLVTVDASGNNGYFSSYKMDGKGQEDIYQFVLDKAELRHAVFMVYLAQKGTPEIDLPLLIRNDSGKDVGTYFANAKTLRYIIALKPGNYKLYALKDSGEDFLQDISVTPLNVNKFTNELNIEL